MGFGFLDAMLCVDDENQQCEHATVTFLQILVER
jgi:hypothetical protein